MSKFMKAFEHVLRWEGESYHEVPGDHGGGTKFGISSRAYPGLGIEALTEEQARELYYDDYWVPMRCEEIPDRAVSIYVFDGAVNHGLSNGTEIVQATVGATPDGSMGPSTLAYLRGACVLSPEITLLKLRATRAEYYRDIVRSNPDQLKFLMGWLNRAYAHIVL